MRKTPEWTTVLFKDASTFTHKPRTLQIDDFEDIPFVPMELVPEGILYSDQFVLKKAKTLGSGTYFEPGDILLAKITPSFENGKQTILPSLPLPFGYASTELIPFRERHGVSDRTFLFFYLLRADVRGELAGKMEGTTGRQRLNKSSLENLPIALPPLKEQESIGRVLVAIQEAGQTRQRELQLEIERKNALRQFLFTRGTRREQTEVKQGLELPHSWNVDRFGTACEFLQYGTSRRCDASVGAPVLGIPDVVTGKVDLRRARYLNATDKEREKLSLRREDLLFVRTNATRKNTGKCAVFKNGSSDVLFASYLIRARLKPHTFVADFVREYTETPVGKSYLSGKASHAADGKFNINTQTIRNVLISQPSWEEQLEIVDTLRSCDTKIESIEKELSLLGEFFAAMSEEMMTGRLSVSSLAEDAVV
jgi:type I restriction enzyme S subunit